MALAFAATDTFAPRRPGGRPSSISRSEIPLVLGLDFAAPLAMLAGRLIGSAAVMIAYCRSPPLKIVFNLSLFVPRKGPPRPATTPFWALAPDTAVAGPATWLAAYAAAFVCFI